MEETKNFNLKSSKLGLILLSILILFLSIYLVALTRNAFATYDYIGRSDQQIYTISINGTGEVTATPDIAEITLGVTTERNDVGQAQQENTDKMNKIIAELKNLGIAQEDIKTVNYSIYPSYDYSQNGRRLLGYVVDQSVRVKIRDLESISEVVAFAGTSGANNVSGLNFTIDDPENLKQEAREKALANAKEKAEKLAEIAGVKLGKLVSFHENDQGYPEFRAYALDSAMGLGGGGDAPTFEPGSQDIVINVSVTYEVL